MTLNIDSLRTQLETLNQDLARLTEQAPFELARQTGEAETDMLFLYGIVGGKDVGKTSLINQLAGSRISIDSDILDEGTKTAVAYCHQNDVAALQKRFMAEIGERVKTIPHNRNELRNVVLLDFPDYDSRFIQHRDDVIRLGKYLQALVWIITPRKYGDHEFIDQMEAIAQSNENYLVVLNKMDQLDGKAEPSNVRREVTGYLNRECDKRGIPPLLEERLLLVSALHPQRYEFTRLHDTIVRQHSPEEILKAKAGNLKAEFEKNLSRMRAYYALPGRIAEMDDALEAIRNRLGEQFDDDYFTTVKQRVLTLDTIQNRISSGLFFQRIQHWPILRTLFYPLAGLISLIGGRFAFVSRASQAQETPRDLLWYGECSASNRMQSIRLGLEERYPELTNVLGELPDYADLAEREFSRLLHLYEEKIIQNISETIGKPGTVHKFAIFFPLVWFPFLQPLAIHFSDLQNPVYSLAGIKELLYLFVSLLGAGNLLENLIFLLIFYMIWLIVLYARGARLAQKEGEAEFQNLWYESLIPWMLDVLGKPFDAIRSQWIEKRIQLDEIEKEIETELDELIQA